MADCVSWVSRLTLLNLRTNWPYGHALRMGLVCMYRTYRIYLYLSRYGDKAHEIKVFTVSFTAVPPTPKTCLVQMSH